jgi:hypothetical protein
VTEAVLDMQERFRQRIGRPSRVRSIAIRFTEDEARELEEMASALYRACSHTNADGEPLQTSHHRQASITGMGH